MQYNLENGLLIQAKHLPSPNCDDRPPESEVDLIVVHNISLPPNIFGGPYIEAFFMNQLDSSLHPYFAEIQHLKVSCHCLIKRNGEITQFVPFHKRAWHAGDSDFQGRIACNDYSIGIELEGADEIPYEDIQYKTLAKVIDILQKNYQKITSDRIVGHSTVSPGRKTDPGNSFDWGYLRKLLNVQAGI